MYPEDGLLILCTVCVAGAFVLDILASPLTSDALGLGLLLLFTWIVLQILRKGLRVLSVWAAKNPGGKDRPRSSQRMSQVPRGAKNPKDEDRTYRATDRNQLDLSAETIDDYRRD